MTKATARPPTAAEAADRPASAHLPQHESDGEQTSALYRAGKRFSAAVSDISAHPYAQLGVIAVCVGWFAIGLDAGLLTAALSILAITLSQMVLSRQNDREVEAHRRDVAMHAKLDELIIAVRRAHNEMAGIEELPEDVIVEMKEQNLQLAGSSGEQGDANQPQRPKNRRADSRG